MRNETQGGLVESAEEQCHRLARHSNADKASALRTRDTESGCISRRENGITVPERQVSVALTRHHPPPNIDSEQEIVAPVRDGPNGSYGVAQTGQRSRHDG